LRIVVEEGGNRGQRNLELADRDVALRELSRCNIVGADQPVGAGHDNDRIVGIRKRDDRRARVRLGGLPHQTQVHALCGEKRSQLLSERVRTQEADQRGRSAEFCRGDGLVRAFAAWKI
jgi:hypothetical protein